MKKTMGKVIGKTSYGSDEELWDRLAELGFFDPHPSCTKCNIPYNTIGAFSVAVFREVHRMRGNKEPSRGDVVARVRYPQVHPCRSWVGDGEESDVAVRRDRMSHNTWSAYRKVLQQVVDLTLEREWASGSFKLGGKGKIVEVDECKLHSAKYHRGHPPETDEICVVELIELDRDDNGSRKSAFMLTTRRPQDVLVPFIKKWVPRSPS